MYCSTAGHLKWFTAGETLCGVCDSQCIIDTGILKMPGQGIKTLYI